MSELERQTTSADPIAALHKMSTTAGAATQEYVAINNLAVSSAALGVASALAFVGSLFLLLGVAALLCGYWSLRQIRGSSGTQGGRGLAWAGIVLSLALAGAVFASNLREQQARAAEARQVTELVNQLGKLVVAGDFKAAYALFHPEFAKKVTIEQFSQTWLANQLPDRLGTMREMVGNGLVDFAPIADGGMTAATTILFRFENYKNDFVRKTVLLQRSGDGVWRIKLVQDTFDTGRPRTPRAQ